MSPKDKFIDDEVSFQGRFSKSMLQSLYWAFSEWRLRVCATLFCGFMGRCSLLLVSVVIGFWADSLCRGHAQCRPLPNFVQHFDQWHFIGVISALVLGGILFSSLFLILTATTGIQVAARYKHEAMLRVSRTPMSFLDRNPIGRIFARFSSDYQTLTYSIGPQLGQISSIVIDLTLMAVMVIFTNIYFIPLLMLSAAFNYFLYRLNNPLIRQARREAAAQRAPSIAHFTSTVEGYLTIKVFQREQHFSDYFHTTLNDFYRGRAKADITFQLFAFQMTGLAALLVLSSGLLGLLLMKHNLASVGEVGIILTFVTLQSAFIQRLFMFLNALEQGMAAAERLNQYLRIDLEPHAALPSKARYPTQHPRINLEPDTHPKHSESGARLCVDKLCFRYREDLPLILNNLSFEITAGESIGIIGRTGSGKSTLFQALLHLYPLASGHITVDGRTAGFPTSLKENELYIDEWRALFAYVTQDPALFQGTLRENLNHMQSPASAEQLTDVLEKVGLGLWLRSRSLGLDTRIEENGTNLSAGQRQLISTARCLLRQSPIVLMDEATSAIDPQSEDAFVEATERFLKDRTRLIIAHRLSTIRNCDRLLWIDKGQLKMFDRPSFVLKHFLGSSAHEEPNQKPLSRDTDAPDAVYS